MKKITEQKRKAREQEIIKIAMWLKDYNFLEQELDKKQPYKLANIKEKDPVKKSYYACHCPFARESVLSAEKTVDSEWCYCSAGFAKYPFEIILGRELDVKLLKSALDGEAICRFEIDLGDGGFK